MILGGIIIPNGNVNVFIETMQLYRVKHNMRSELKWSKVKHQKLDEYKAFVDYFFALVNSDKIHFKSVIFDNHTVDHKKYSGGDKEKGFYKFYYQLLFNCFGRQYYSSETNEKFIVHPDQRQSSYGLDELKTVLNNGMRKKFKTSDSPFISIEPVNSKNSEIVQINDIIIGAIGFVKNGYHLLSASNKGKVELSKYIESKAGLMDLGSNTRYGMNRFSVWNFNLQAKK